MNEKDNQIIIYNDKSGSSVEVRLQDETVWLNQKMISELFNIERSVIAKHIKNIYKDEELIENSTCAKIAQVQTEGKRQITRDIDFYNLDIILSVGYRVNSKNATSFRIWATTILKKHLVDGYTVNEKRLLENNQKIHEIRKAIDLIERGLNNQIENLEGAKQLIKILSDYASGLALLDNYDHEKLDKTGKSEKEAKQISVNEFLLIIKEMTSKFESNVFAVPKDNSFESSINQVYQTIDGKDAYPTLEEKAATLLYLITKNHSFADGNKRIAAACFLYFLNENNMLYRKNESKIIDNEALALLTLLIAESKPSEMETMKNIILSILNKKE